MQALDTENEGATDAVGQGRIVWGGAAKGQGQAPSGGSIGSKRQYKNTIHSRPDTLRNARCRMRAGRTVYLRVRKINTGV